MSSRLERGMRGLLSDIRALLISVSDVCLHAAKPLPKAESALCVFILARVVQPFSCRLTNRGLFWIPRIDAGVWQVNECTTTLVFNSEFTLMRCDRKQAIRAALLKAIMRAGLRAAEKERCKPSYTARYSRPCHLGRFQTLMRGWSKTNRALLILV